MRLFIAQPTNGIPEDEINMTRGIVARAYIDHLIGKASGDAMVDYYKLTLNVR